MLVWCSFDFVVEVLKNTLTLRIGKIQMEFPGRNKKGALGTLNPHKAHIEGKRNGVGHLSEHSLL